ncbi:type II secretion system protein [Vibrio parahaemolyticus]|nr:prepilin-type N-terminal cleavage/methylation domain-containing protein [Vibrio parahaemolyticus]EKH9202316.1 prepilin-type N-terminal cleavage/methylation domain-containing protein [Vibrio parahaemolyticus]
MKSRSTISGFTLIELIMVIVILSILSLYASSRFIRTGISAVAIQDQVISVVRQVQVNRMQSNVASPDNNFRLQVSSSCVGSVAACALTGSAQDARSDVVIDNSAKFSVISGAANTINFNLLGNPVSGAVYILIEDKRGRSRCQVEINTQGYVSKGTCS